MDFLTLVKERFSVRKFQPKAVEQELVEQILQAGRLAPTAKNNQPQRVLVLQSEEALEKLKECTGSHYHAPLAFVVCYDDQEDWERPFDGAQSGVVDASIVCTHMMLEAAELGLGTVWVMHFDPKAIRAAYQLPEQVIPVAVLPTGYIAEDCVPAPRHSERKELGETVVYDQF